MTTQYKSPRERMAEQLGDAGFHCLAQIKVAAATALDNIERLEDLELTTDDYEYCTHVYPLVQAVKKQCSAIVDAYKYFSEGQERFTMMLQLSEILNRVEPSIEYSEKLCAAPGKHYVVNDDEGKSCIVGVSGDLLKHTQSMDQPKTRLQTVGFAKS